MPTCWPSYSILNRWIEDDKLDSLALSEGFGIAVFSPLYQGFLTSKYLKGIPADSRVGRGETWIGKELNDKMIEKLNKLNDIIVSRGQTFSNGTFMGASQQGCYYCAYRRKPS